MKNLFFKLHDEKLRDDIAEKAFEMIRNGKCSEAYELRDIVLGKWNGKEPDDFGFGISVDDCVGASFYITACMIGENEGSPETTVIDSELFTESLKVPQTVTLEFKWEKDAENRYKAIKLHFDEIKGMARQGVSPEDIANTFGVSWSEDDSKWILEKDRI